MLATEIESKTARLETYPKRYKAARVRGTREYGVTTGNYLVVYRLQDADVLILRVLHADQWP